MTKADYEARRKLERERRKLEEAEADRREQREREATEFMDVSLPALRAFFQGKAYFEIEPADPALGQGMRVRFWMD